MSAATNPSEGQNPYAPPRARVRDVAAPSASLVLAERSTRLGAAIVDSLIFSAMVYIPMLVGMLIAGMGSSSDDPSGAFVLLGMGLAFVGFVVWTWLTLKQMGATGQSLAKKYFNIKVVHTDGSQVPLSTLILKRNVLTWLLSIIPLYGIIEVLFIFSEQRQCLHDKMADTLVVEA